MTYAWSMTNEEIEDGLARSRALRYELTTTYRELQENMEMVIERIPTMAKDPEYIKYQEEVTVVMLGTLDSANAYDAMLLSLEADDD
jgi:hypothetical protein